MGTKEWLKDNSTKETKGVQNRDKVIMKDQEIESYGVGSELLDEFNSRVLSATVVVKIKRKLQHVKRIRGRVREYDLKKSRIYSRIGQSL